MILHGYFRSSAAWRIRIALALKGLTAKQVSHHLAKNEQYSKAYLDMNPQGLVPALETDDGAVITQSLAIIEYLEAMHPEPRLIPADLVEAAHVRAFALAIACDIHPVQNLRVLRRIASLGHDEATVKAWAHDTVKDGLDALEIVAARQPGPFCFGGAPTLADVFLVPQLGNARRFGVELAHTRLLEAEAAAMALRAFADAVPARQPDAE